MKILSRADELSLLAVWRLQDNAYGVSIRNHIINTTSTEWSVGSIYDSLEKLEHSGHLTSFQSDPTPERGGRRKRYYSITKLGLESLQNTKKVQESMWNDLPEPNFKFIK